jgi:hypothetical protein
MEPFMSPVVATRSQSAASHAVARTAEIAKAVAVGSTGYLRRRIPGSPLVRLFFLSRSLRPGP